MNGTTCIDTILIELMEKLDAWEEVVTEDNVMFLMEDCGKIFDHSRSQTSFWWNLHHVNLVLRNIATGAVTAHPYSETTPFLAFSACTVSMVTALYKLRYHGFIDGTLLMRLIGKNKYLLYHLKYLSHFAETVIVRLSWTNKSVIVYKVEILVDVEEALTFSLQWKDKRREGLASSSLGGKEVSPVPSLPWFQNMHINLHSSLSFTSHT